MFSVALIGPDGAGKTTVGRRLGNVLPLPVKYIYMGINRDSSNHMLPTTRLIRAIKRFCGAKPDTAGPPDPNKAKVRPKGLVKAAWSSLKAGLRLANQLSEEFFRQSLAWYYQRRGHIVLFDRHYFADYHAYDIASGPRERPLSRRIHGFVLSRFMPKPDLVIYLDAPAEVLFARKGEGTIEALERRRQDYLQLQGLVKRFILVDAAQAEDDVTREVTKQIWDFYEARTAKPAKPQNVHV